jgi:lactoylglutathione lyase
MEGGKMAAIGALILFAADVGRTVRFYEALGLPLEPEQHDDEPVHFAADVDGCHVAVFPAAEHGVAPGALVAGETMAGLRVPSTEDAVEAVRRLGARIIQEPDDYPWGRRALVEDPDGRRVEVFTPPVVDRSV